MATALPGNTTSQKNITCAICTEILREPQSLSCLHNFCRKCLKNVDRKTEGGKHGICCPICRQFTGERDIAPNAIMEKLVELLEDFYKDKIMNRTDFTDKFCVQCNRCKVISHCMQCKFDLCDVCKVTHLRMPTCGDHQIVPLQEASNHPVINIVKYCPEHPDKAIKLSCVPCGMAICTECKYQRHDTHKTVSVEAALQKVLPEVKVQLQALKQANDATVQSKECLAAAVQNMQDDIGAIITEINNEAKRTKAKIDRDRNTLVEMLANHEQAVVKENQLLQDDMNNLTSSAESLFFWAQTLADIGQGSAVLFALQNELTGRIQRLTDENTLPPSFRTLLQKAENKVTFKPRIDASGNAIGEVDISSAATSISHKYFEGNLQNLVLKEMIHRKQLQHKTFVVCCFGQNIWIATYNGCVQVYSVPNGN